MTTCTIVSWVTRCRACAGWGIRDNGHKCRTCGGSGYVQHVKRGQR
jgi:DnaJ-class molecular chaperone